MKIRDIIIDGLARLLIFIICIEVVIFVGGAVFLISREIWRFLLWAWGMLV